MTPATTSSRCSAARAQAAARGTYRAFGETLRGPEDDVRRAASRARRRSSTPRRRRRSTRASAGATSCTASRTRGWRSASAARCARPPARPTASASSRPRTRPRTAVSAGERYAAVYEINLSRCIFCGYCEVACPFDAITMGHDYEMSRLQPLRPDLHQGDAARRAARAHAAAHGGRVASAPRMAEVFFFLAAIGAIAGAVGTVLAAQPVLLGARARLPPARRWRRCSCCCARSSSPPRR